jgi:anti-sigma factor RsiW
MDCELAQQKIALFAYGELPDDQCPALEGHLATCKRCQEEFAAVQALQQAMALAPAQEPSANLLAQARLRLEEALDTMPRTSWLMRVQQSLFRGVGTLGSAPVAASALLVLGLGTGGWAGSQYATRVHRPVAELAGAVEGAGKIANVNSIVPDPNSENVVVHFNRLVPETTQGSLDDPRIRELLVLGTQSQLNPTVDENYVKLLDRECDDGNHFAAG